MSLTRRLWSSFGEKFFDWKVTDFRIAVCRGIFSFGPSLAELCSKLDRPGWMRVDWAGRGSVDRAERRAINRAGWGAFYWTERRTVNRTRGRAIDRSKRGQIHRPRSHSRIEYGYAAAIL